MLEKLRLIAILSFVLILVSFCGLSAQHGCIELGVHDIEIYPSNPCPTDSIEIEALISIAENLPDSLLPTNVTLEYLLNNNLVGRTTIRIDWNYPPCPDDLGSCEHQECNEIWNELQVFGTCEVMSMLDLSGENPEWQCVCKVFVRRLAPLVPLGHFPIEQSFIVTVKIDPDNEFLESDEANNEVTEEFETCGVIPTLTEWGLIIFGVVLLGFITWVFLKRRRVVGVRV